MCRRCGEPDRRGNARTRKRRTERLLEIHGNGEICPCYWCGDLVGRRPGRLHIRGGPGERGVYLRVQQCERDRLKRGDTYAMWNLVPACPPCNKGREIMDNVVPIGCNIGDKPDYELLYGRRA